MLCPGLLRGPDLLRRPVLCDGDVLPSAPLLLRPAEVPVEVLLPEDLRPVRHLCPGRLCSVHLRSGAVRSVHLCSGALRSVHLCSSRLRSVRPVLLCSPVLPAEVLLPAALPLLPPDLRLDLWLLCPGGLCSVHLCSGALRSGHLCSGALRSVHLCSGALRSVRSVLLCGPVLPAEVLRPAALPSPTPVLLLVLCDLRLLCPGGLCPLRLQQLRFDGSPGGEAVPGPARPTGAAGPDREVIISDWTDPPQVSGQHVGRKPGGSDPLASGTFPVGLKTRVRTI